MCSDCWQKLCQSCPHSRTAPCRLCFTVLRSPQDGSRQDNGAGVSGSGPADIGLGMDLPPASALQQLLNVSLGRPFHVTSCGRPVFHYPDNAGKVILR